MSRMNSRVKSNERALSPVIGVMLMLVATVVVAAVVTSYSGGLVGVQQKAPQANLDVEIVSQETQGWSPEFVVKHLGGDPIVTKNVKIVTKWFNATKRGWEVAETVAVKWNETEICYYKYNETTKACEGDKYTNYTDVNTKYVVYDSQNTVISYHEPYLMIPGDLPADGQGKETELWFGNFVLQRGDVMKAQTSISDSNLFKERAVIKNATSLKPGDVVSVEIIDLNTNTKIFSKEVVVR